MSNLPTPEQVIKTLRSLYPDRFTDDDLFLAAHCLQHQVERRTGLELIACQREEFRNYTGEPDIVSFIVDRYHDAYTFAWKYLYHSPVGLNGVEPGGWFADMWHAILRAAAIQADRPELLIGEYKSTKGQDRVDHDKFLGLHRDIVFLSEECKLQADKTSLKKAIDSSNQNHNIPNNSTRRCDYCTIGFATNNAFTANNGQTSIGVLQSKGVTSTDAHRVVQDIIQRQCGAFEVNKWLSILILGSNQAEYLAWDDKPMANHGGKGGVDTRTISRPRNC